MSELPADDLDFGRSESPGAAPPPLAAAARPAGVAGERSISPVAGRLGLGKGGKAVAVLGLVAGCGVFLAATWTRPKAHTPAGPQEPARQAVDWTSVRGASGSGATPGGGAGGLPGGTRSDGATLTNPGSGAPSLGVSPAGQIVPAIGVDAADPAAATPLSQHGPVDAKTAAAQQVAATKAAKLAAVRSAPLLAYSAEVRGRTAAPADGLLTASARPVESGPASELDQLRRGSALGLVRAQRLPDRNFLLAAGALLPCVLETAMDTSAPGFVTCRITRDIYSDNGGVVLMEKGSRVVGEYRSGFTQGHARIFVLWDRITTPGGVAVDVSSPASDALGRAGFDGRIDSHFWQRFGGALLLTTVGGGLSAAATADARFANVAQSPNEAATAALQNSINIAPTLTKPQGAEVGVFVSHDLDFSSVYALKAR